MDWSQLDHARVKKWLIIAIAGFVLLFLILTFAASYYQYQTSGPISEEAASSYNEGSFRRLRAELTKDRPQKKEQTKILSQIVQQTNKQVESSTWPDGTGRKVSQGTFDTLAVNCGVLLERYKELAIKYHELQKQLKSGSTKPVAKSMARKKAASSSAFNQGFDYTKYVRSGASNELLNESERGAAATAEFSWATLFLPSGQKVFDQSIIVFEISEAFDLNGETIPQTAKIEGVAQVSRGRGRVFVTFQKIYLADQTIPIQGEAFALDKSRGLNVYIHGESTLAQSVRREAGDLVSLVDPSRSQVARSLINDTDVGLEVFATIEAGSMLLARISRI